MNYYTTLLFYNLIYKFNENRINLSLIDKNCYNVRPDK